MPHAPQQPPSLEPLCKTQPSLFAHFRNRHNGRGRDGAWPDDATRERITSCACRTAVGALGEMTLQSYQASRRIEVEISENTRTKNLAGLGSRQGSGDWCRVAVGDDTNRTNVERAGNGNLIWNQECATGTALAVERVSFSAVPIESLSSLQLRIRLSCIYILSQDLGFGSSNVVSRSARESAQAPDGPGGRTHHTRLSLPGPPLILAWKLE